MSAVIAVKGDEVSRGQFKVGTTASQLTGEVTAATNIGNGPVQGGFLRVVVLSPRDTGDEGDRHDTAQAPEKLAALGPRPVGSTGLGGRCGRFRFRGLILGNLVGSRLLGL